MSMRAFRLAFNTGALALLSLTAASAASGVVSVVEEDFAVESAEKIRLRVPVGELRVVGEPDRDSVSVRINIRCSSSKGWFGRGFSAQRCADKADKVALQSNRSGDELEIVVKAPGRAIRIEVEVAVPAALDLDANLRIGELSIEGVSGDLRARVGIGELRAEMAEAVVEGLRISARIGDARVEGRRKIVGNRSFLIGASIDHHDGLGDAEVELRVRIGEVRLRLI